VTWTERATIDVLNENLTPDDVLDAIVSHIEEGREVNKSITRNPPHTGKVIFEMLPVIEERNYYVKVQLWERKGGERLIVISAHVPRKGG
jgi:(2Fe-2S) ferredoxin